MRRKKERVDTCPLGGMGYVVCWPGDAAPHEVKPYRPMTTGPVRFARPLLERSVTAAKPRNVDRGVTYRASKDTYCHSYSYLFKKTGEVITIKLSITSYMKLTDLSSS